MKLDYAIHIDFHGSEGPGVFAGIWTGEIYEIVNNFSPHSNHLCNYFREYSGVPSGIRIARVTKIAGSANYEIVWTKYFTPREITRIKRGRLCEDTGRL